MITYNIIRIILGTFGLLQHLYQCQIMSEAGSVPTSYIAHVQCCEVSETFLTVVGVLGWMYVQKNQ